ncbi:hypothetical protein [Sediminibacterium sp.]|uniref:hypothetical protein n=1 Tax=Sediminibacterium sp. TaxID=1917865 RepID=UPI0025D838F1|nr:hypothetical protein [Sediminibacterium sp.]
MKEIVSKKHKIKFYLALLLSCFSLLLIATILLREFLNQWSSNYLYSKYYFILVISILIYFITVYVIYAYLRNAPRIKVNSNSITFNNEEFFWLDIAHIELVGKKRFPFLGKYYMEATTLTFKNGINKVIFDDMYSNTWEIKSFIKMVVIDKIEFSELPNSSIVKEALAFDFFDTFKGNQITSFRGICLWGFIGFFVFKAIISRTPVNIEGMLFVFGFSLFWFIAFSYQMHYFQVSDNYFLVRNHNFNWKKKAYNINEIKEIVFETRGKMPNCLRVITNDFKYNLYPAGTLRDKNWLDLKDKLEKHKIKVRNECI